MPNPGLLHRQLSSADVLGGETLNWAQSAGVGVD